jgi:hypothetical protein
LNIISEKVRHAIQHMKSYSLLVKQEWCAFMMVDNDWPFNLT